VLYPLSYEGRGPRGPRAESARTLPAVGRCGAVSVAGRGHIHAMPEACGGRLGLVSSWSRVRRLARDCRRRYG
jgi:hypothetical protein